jgi:hypothetical protein
VEVEVEVSTPVVLRELAIVSSVCDEFFDKKTPELVSVTDELPVALLPKTIVLLIPDIPVILAPPTIRLFADNCGCPFGLLVAIGADAGSLKEWT